MLPEIDFDEQIALCRSLGVRYYQYRPREIPPQHRGGSFGLWCNYKFDLTPQRLLEEGAELTSRLRAAGLEPWGTVPVLTIDMPDHLIRLNVEAAARAGAKCVRCNPASYPKGIFDYAQLLDRAVARYQDLVRRIAVPAGIKLVLETHCFSLAASPGLAWNICRQFDPEHLGLILDLNNFQIEGQIQPKLAVSMLRGHIDCLHVGGSRRVKTTRDSFGCAVPSFERCSLEEGDLYLPGWVEALQQANIEVPVIIEDYQPGLSSRERLERCVCAWRRIERG